ncbi:MAG: hypothetical protein U0821_00775 [Chloroflexota bacterium]
MGREATCTGTLQFVRRVLTSVFAVVSAVLTPSVQWAYAETFTVINDHDTGPGSLHQAIDDANANPGKDRVEFAIPGSGVRTIFVTTMPFSITESVVVDATSQPGYEGAPLIELRPGPGSFDFYGVRVVSGASEIRGLSISGFRQNVVLGSAGNRLVGNVIGAKSDGTATPGSSWGVLVEGSDNVIGGASPSDRNVIAGNSGPGIQVMPGAAGTSIRGNFIGTNPGGNAAVPNGNGVWVQGPNTTIGGTTAEDRNVIAGNTWYGVSFYDPPGEGPARLGGALMGNYVGVQADGRTPLGNGPYGVLLDYATGVTIGGTAPGAANVISGNSVAGIKLFSTLDGRMDNSILGNLIGTDASGLAPVPNGIGILVGKEYPAGNQGTQRGNTIGGALAGQGNRVAFNSVAGIVVKAGQENTVSGNLVFGNGPGGAGPQIDLGADGSTANDPLDADGGPNHGQNFPVLGQASYDAGVLTVTGELSSSPNLAGVRIELFGGSVCSPAGYGEARYFLGSTTVSTNASGNAPFSVALGSMPAGVTHVTATATTADGDTSELSKCVAVSMPAPLSSGREPGAGSSLSGSGRPLEAPGRRVSVPPSTGASPAPVPGRR